MIQIASAQTNSEQIGPQSFDFEISTDQPIYHYTYEQSKHEEIRILAKIPQIIPNEKVVVESIYSRGPHRYTDTYSVCSDITATNCFAKLEGDIYFVESNRQYGNLFGKWALDATYAGKRSTTIFEITTLNKFDIDVARQEYTIKDLKDIGLEIIFSGSEISDQTTLTLEIFKINPTGQELVLKRDIPVQVDSEPPYFNRLPITFPNNVPFDAGQYNITARWGHLYDSDIFEIVKPVLTTNDPIEDTNGVKNGGCLIATAAFGSELAPQVQMLREIRDEKFLSTISGASFLQAFNSLYYSFSPTIANAERQNPALQVVIKTALYPLIGILKTSEITTMLGGEIGIISTGFVSGTLIGAVYLWPLSLRFDITREYRKVILVMITSIGLIVFGTVFHNTNVLMVSTIIFVLTTFTFGVLLARSIINLVRPKNKKRAN
ncbi:MAG TPA: CFI-box-CTERM domain-containing protein [Nitrosopumilaceae archaeon]|nr:CFI-box-CTERM domain-containing protein [Nitrosopumilaceae archaeon]